MRACAAPTQPREQAARLDPRRSRVHPRQHPGQHALRAQGRDGAGRQCRVDVAAKGGGSENKSKFKMMNPTDSIVDWVLEMVPQMGAGWCPPGMLGIGIGGTAENAMKLAKESLMGRSTWRSSRRAGRRTTRGAADRDLRQGQRAGHRRAGAGRALDHPRRQDHGLAVPRRGQAGGDDPQLRRHAPRAFHARRLGARLSRGAEARRMARGRLEARQGGEARRSRHADARRGAELEARRPAAAQRQDAHRPRRRAQAHQGHAGEGRGAAGRVSRAA